MSEGAPGPVRVALVDDQELVRTGFRMMLDAQPDMTVVGEAADGLAAVALAAAGEADVMVMDVRMPRLDGVEAARRICAAGERPRVLMLTTFDLDEYAFAALKAGASGFLLKDVPPRELLFAIRAVHSGDSVVAPSTTRRLIDRFVPMLPAGAEGETPPAAADLAGLTDREREVLVQVAAGLSNAEIATRLFVSEATVKTHVGRILAKLGLRDRVQAVVLAYETGLVRARTRPSPPPGSRDLREPTVLLSRQAFRRFLRPDYGICPLCAALAARQHPLRMGWVAHSSHLASAGGHPSQANGSAATAIPYRNRTSVT